MADKHGRCGVQPLSQRDGIGCLNQCHTHVKPGYQRHRHARATQFAYRRPNRLGSACCYGIRHSFPGVPAVACGWRIMGLPIINRPQHTMGAQGQPERKMLVGIAQVHTTDVFDALKAVEQRIAMHM